MTPEERNEKAREMLRVELNTNYNNLITFLNRIPFHQKIKDFCFQNLDQGIHWAEKAILMVEFKEVEKQNGIEDLVAKDKAEKELETQKGLPEVSEANPVLN